MSIRQTSSASRYDDWMTRMVAMTLCDQYQSVIDQTSSKVTAALSLLDAMPNDPEYDQVPERIKDRIKNIQHMLEEAGTCTL
jgi:hypothetical protein